jgi:hypothetical protein
MPFAEALDKLGAQSPVGAALSSSEWSDLPVELRENAFFSANVESVRVLQAMKDSLGDYLAANTKRLDDGQTLLATGGRAAFVDQMQKLLASMGVQREGGGLRDITSQRRLGLIFDIKTQQAGDYGYWRQGMDPDVLNEFPASRFIRVKAVKEPRQSHNIYEDQVFLKTDPIWALVINQDFHVPWGPWGWGCGHDVEDVDRDEAIDLGLLKRGQKLVPDKKYLNTNLQASAHGIEPELLAKMKQVFGPKIKIEGDVIRWNAHPPGAIPAPETVPKNIAPVSDAITVRVRGTLKEEVDEALKAIDEVHDDGELPAIPLKTTARQDALGYMRPVWTARGIETQLIAVRPDGSWPALTAVHEIGHFLDLSALGVKGNYATSTGYDPMKQILAAAEKTDAIKNLRAQLKVADSYSERRVINYYLKPVEIWARVYAQFIAERSSSELLKLQIKTSLMMQDKLNLARFRQWHADDFAPIADAVEAMFKQLNWI